MNPKRSEAPRVEPRGIWLLVGPIRIEKEHSSIESRFDNPSCPRKRASRFQAFYGSYLDSRSRGNDKDAIHPRLEKRGILAYFREALRLKVGESWHDIVNRVLPRFLPFAEQNLNMIFTVLAFIRRAKEEG